MRYRLTRGPQYNLAQVMTPPRLAKRVVEFLSGNGDSWLELGSGNGRIAQACLAARSPQEYFGIEVDQGLLKASPVDPRARFEHGDVLVPADITSLLGDRLFSHVVGNPPYGMKALGEECQRRFAELCPGIPQTMDWVQLDLYFVLESLARLRRPGEAAFIVGAPIAEDSRLLAFRKALVSRASEVECFELPPDVFEGKAEVQSYLLVVRFGESELRKVRLGRMAGDDLAIIDERWVEPRQAENRLDFGFHEFELLNQSLCREPGCKTLSELGASIVRGSRTRSQFDGLGIDFFHTSDFPREGSEVGFHLDRDHGFQVATVGDILLPRVGTRCLDRQALVTKGRRHYTEAVYRLRVPKQTHSEVVNWIFSDKGAKWRQAAAKGSCAKHITVASLMSMPVPATI